MESSKEEQISEIFVEVELKLNSIVQMCVNAKKPLEEAEWVEERRLTLLKFDKLVATAESRNSAAQNTLLSALKRCLLRVHFIHELAEYGIFVVCDEPGKLFPETESLRRLIKKTVSRKL